MSLKSFRPAKMDVKFYNMLSDAAPGDSHFVNPFLDIGGVYPSRNPRYAELYDPRPEIIVTFRAIRDSPSRVHKAFMDFVAEYQSLPQYSKKSFMDVIKGRFLSAREYLKESDGSDTMGVTDFAGLTTYLMSVLEDKYIHIDESGDIILKIFPKSYKYYGEDFIFKDARALSNTTIDCQGFHETINDLEDGRVIGFEHPRNGMILGYDGIEQFDDDTLYAVADKLKSLDSKFIVGFALDRCGYTLEDIMEAYRGCKGYMLYEYTPDGLVFEEARDVFFMVTNFIPQNYEKVYFRKVLREYPLNSERM